MEVEEFVDPALIFRCGVGEVLGRLVGQVIELGETGTAGAAFGVPDVELGEVASEGCSLVVDLFKGGGKLVVVDVLTGVGSDDAGFFEVELVEAVASSRR